MSGFKAAVAADVGRTFMNPKEFGDAHTIDGKPVVCVVDGDLLKERPGSAAPGVFLEEMVVFVATTDLDPPPVQGQQVRFDGNLLLVERVDEAMGILEIKFTANET